MTFAEILEALRDKDRVPDGVVLPQPLLVIPSAEGYVDAIPGVAEAEAGDLDELQDDEEQHEQEAQ